MSPDNEYFWIDPEEVRALTPKKRIPAVTKAESAAPAPAPALVTVLSPVLEAPPSPAPVVEEVVSESFAPPAPAPEISLETPFHNAPEIPLPNWVEQNFSAPPMPDPAPEPSEVYVAETFQPSSLGRDAESFHGRTPDERVETLVEWIGGRYAGAAVAVVTNARVVVTARQADPDLLGKFAQALPDVVGSVYINPDSEPLVQQLYHDYRFLDASDSQTVFLPVICQPLGTILSLVIHGAPDLNAVTADAPSLQQVFASLVEGMLRG